MPETPPPAAVQIAAAALGYETHSQPGMAQAVVAALARAGWLHDPGSYSERSRAEVIALVKRQAAELAARRVEVERLRVLCAQVDEQLEAVNAGAAALRAVAKAARRVQDQWPTGWRPNAAVITLFAGLAQLDALPPVASSPAETEGWER